MTDSNDNLTMPFKKPFLAVAMIVAITIIIGLAINDYRRGDQFDEFKSRICGIELLEEALSEIISLQTNGPKDNDEMKDILERIDVVFPPEIKLALYYEWSGGLWKSMKWETSTRFNLNHNIGKLGEWSELTQVGECTGRRTDNTFEIFLPINTSKGTIGMLVTKRING